MQMQETSINMFVGRVKVATGEHFRDYNNREEGDSPHVHRSRCTENPRRFAGNELNEHVVASGAVRHGHFGTCGMRQINME